MYFYNARYYDPALGRFIQADTIVPSPANPQSLNRYSYVLNSPLRYTDPTGHAHWAGDDGGGEDYWMEGLTPKVKVRAYEAYRHYQKDPAYFEKLYLLESDNDELMYLSIYAEYHDRVYLESLMQINPPVLAAEAFAQLEGLVASGQIDTETANQWALTYIGIIAISEMLENVGGGRVVEGTWVGPRLPGDPTEPLSGSEWQGWEWRGAMDVDGNPIWGQGGYWNESRKMSMSPHPAGPNNPHGPHWDYNYRSSSQKWRVFPNNYMEMKRK